MAHDVHIPNAGAPDPELKNSPIFDHESFETEAADLELETGVCYFNGITYAIGDVIRSGDEILRCEERGVWMRIGTQRPVSAVRQGRTLYDNILKFVRFQLSTTIGAILTVFFAPLASLPEPFTPIQILWVAIIMDGPPAVSLALDAARPGIMFEPPRSHTEPLLPFSRLAKIMAYGITMMVGTLTVLYYGQYYGLHTGTEQRALTLALTTFVLFQFFNVFNARTEKGTSFNAHFFDNTMLWVSLAGIIALQALAVHWPRAQPIFGTGGMTLADWGIATGVAASVLILEEGRKLALAMLGRFGPRAPPAGSV